MTNGTRKLIDDLNQLWTDGDSKGGSGATCITETIGSGANARTRSYKPMDTALIMLQIMQTEIEAAKAGQPAQHDKGTIAQARALLRAAQWHGQTAEEQAEAEEWQT